MVPGITPPEKNGPVRTVGKNLQSHENVPGMGLGPKPPLYSKLHDMDGTSQISFNLNSSQYYLNRETSWLQFNERVLSLAQDEKLPLLERVKFTAITASNLDEFFMKRIGGLKQLSAAGVMERTVDGRTADEQIRECLEFVTGHHSRLQDLLPSLFRKLKKAGIEIIPYLKLSGKEREWIRSEYYDRIYPLITPQSIDPAHPFPFISNLSLNLLLTLRYEGEESVQFARVKVPVGPGSPRFFRIGNHDRFVLLEDIVSNNLDMLFPEMEILTCELFRVTRNANTSKNKEKADDLLALIESELRDRKFAPIVRLGIVRGMDPVHRGRLAAELGLNENLDVFEVKTLLGVRHLWEIANLNRPDLKFPAHYPIEHPDLPPSRSIFHTIRDEKAILVHHPYESFNTSVERLLKEAAMDLKVMAIKMTLYRTEPESDIIKHLIEAANRGKQVTVVVELKASFDEAVNIRVANKMEEAGIHVTYGVMGLKTHCKLILIVRRDYNGLRRYVHIGTGNYHPMTSRIYSDLGLLVYDKDLGRDTTELFNYLTTGFTPKRTYRKLLVAPKILKRALLDKIDREIRLAKSKSPGRVIFKMNALEDEDITRALYAASMAGVKVDLIIRDSCRIRPGMQEFSQNIRVFSVLGRFLEHSRIYFFHNGGQSEYFIGSADSMKRNLEHRVEVLAPVESAKLKKELDSILQTQLEANVHVWEMQSDGTYLPRGRKSGQRRMDSQEVFINVSEKRKKEAAKLKKRKSALSPRSLVDE